LTDANTVTNCVVCMFIREIQTVHELGLHQQFETLSLPPKQVTLVVHLTSLLTLLSLLPKWRSFKQQSQAVTTSGTRTAINYVHLGPWVPELWNVQILGQCVVLHGYI